MKKLMTLALMLAAVAPSAWANKVGVVDIRAVMSQLPQGEAVAQQLQTEFAERIAGVRKMQTELQALAEKEQKDALLMSATEKEELSAQIAKLNREIRRKGEAVKEDMNTRQQEEQNKLLRQVQLSVNAIAEQEKYDMILQRGAALYVAPSADITSKVIEAVSKGN